MQEANVLLVHVNIHEATHFAFFVEETFLDAGITALEFDDSGADGIGVHFHKLLVVGELPQRRGNSNFGRHNSIKQEW